MPYFKKFVSSKEEIKRKTMEAHLTEASENL
jgi:hypothetical protein